MKLLLFLSVFLQLQACALNYSVHEPTDYSVPIEFQYFANVETMDINYSPNENNINESKIDNMYFTDKVYSDIFVECEKALEKKC